MQYLIVFRRSSCLGRFGNMKSLQAIPAHPEYHRYSISQIINGKSSDSRPGYERVQTADVPGGS
jgi:hypothetical protein